MMVDSELSDEETRAADESVPLFYANAKTVPCTFQQMLERWSHNVDKIESSYTGSIYEYWNDLDAGTILDEVAEHLGGSLEEKCKALIAPVDDRFVAATRLMREQAIVQGKALGWSWRWYRLPIRLVGELQGDAERGRWR